MKTIKIIDSQALIKKGGHFSYYEFFKPTHFGGVEFDMLECLYESQEIYRDFYKLPWEITCVFRNDIHWGFHPLKLAVDSVPISHNARPNVLEVFKQECLKYQKNKSSELIKSLRKIGIKGFGIENNCIHSDIRPDDHCASKDEYGKYCVFTWYPDDTEYGKSTVIY
jgi:hypothetical protein